MGGANMLSTEGRVLQGVGVSEVASRGQPELCGVSVSLSRAEFSKAMSSIWPEAHKRTMGNRFRGNVGKDIEGMSRDNVREVGDYGNAVPGIGGLVGRSVSRWHSMRKSRGRVRT
jgi:hypothetical protein